MVADVVRTGVVVTVEATDVVAVVVLGCVDATADGEFVRTTGWLIAPAPALAVVAAKAAIGDVVYAVLVLVVVGTVVVVIDVVVVDGCKVVIVEGLIDVVVIDVEVVRTAVEDGVDAAVVVVVIAVVTMGIVAMVGIVTVVGGTVGPLVIVIVAGGGGVGAVHTSHRCFPLLQLGFASQYRQKLAGPLRSLQNASHCGLPVTVGSVVPPAKSLGDAVVADRSDTPHVPQGITALD